MAKPLFIELGKGREAIQIPILFEDRSVLAIDKPPGWMLAPSTWQQTGRNLQLAIESSIAARDFWARSRNLKFLRFVHRLDADTSGILLGVKSPGAVKAYSDLFEGREVEKVYLAIVTGIPSKKEWSLALKLAPHPEQPGRVVVDRRHGKPAETHFKVLEIQRPADRDPLALIECRPVTGRTHQIRVHLAESGCPVEGDILYGRAAAVEQRWTRSTRPPLGLRAVRLAFVDPFSRRRTEVAAPVEDFLKQFGFGSPPDASGAGAALNRGGSESVRRHRDPTG